MPSAVEDLNVYPNHWPDGALEELVRELRTNETMRHLTLHGKDHDFFTRLHLVEALLTTYNCTLEEFELHPLDDDAQARINVLLDRNKRIRSLFFTSGSANACERYHLPRKSMWPHILAEYGRLPTQLYRFVRHGNLEGFASQVEQVASAAAESAAASAMLGRPREKDKRRQPINSDATATVPTDRPCEKKSRRLDAR